MQKAFSLVELSIVIVILGLLTGGILAGQSLIRAAELRSITNSYNRYITAVQSFRDKYFSLPGDMNNAVQFWGAATCPGTLGATATSTTTCNGDGDGVIDWASASTSGSYENFRMWQQLVNASLIEGSYSGVAFTGGERDARPGVNVPSSKISNSGFGVEPWNTIGSGDTWRWAGEYGNALIFGNVVSANHPPENPILRAEEAWNIDIKIDDGRPSRGRIVSHRPIGTWLNCTTSNVDATTEYKLTDTTTSCALIFPRAF